MGTEKVISMNVSFTSTPQPTYRTVVIAQNIVGGVNTLTSSMVSQENTRYIVKYDFILGSNITIPVWCILVFEGGSISNGSQIYTLTGSNTKLTNPVGGDTINSNVPTSGTFIEDEGYNKLRFATWNVAHFSLSDFIHNVIITQDQYVKFYPIYKNIIDDINANFFGMNEFDSPFWADHSEYTTKRELFPSYKYYNDSSENNLNPVWNAYFSRLMMENPQKVFHNSNRPGETRYYLTGDISVNGKSVKVVCAHLCIVPNGNAQDLAINQAQMQEIVDYCSVYDNAVIMGDFNWIDFTPFKNAGYSMVITDFLGNTPTVYNDVSYIDNIILKGGVITAASVVNANSIAGTVLSDHYIVHCDILF